VLSWVQSWGGWAAFALLVWLLLGYPRMRPADRARVPRWLHLGMVGLLVATLVAYLPVFFIVLRGAGTDLIRWLRSQPALPARAASPWYDWSLTVGGLCAIAAVCLPLLRNLPTWRMRRVWALTRLSFKEALRRRVLYVFAALLLVVLFGSWFIPYKPEDQVRTYVQVVYWVMSVLLLFTAVLLASFSIPADVRQQTIHTIVTKPVERFEVFLGRFLGFAGLMTLVLAVMTGVSLLYVLRGVDPLAAAESLKAREPVYGQLRFEDSGGRVTSNRGINVGREWTYRSYISRGGPFTPQLIAVWSFDQLPRGLAGRAAVPCEFSLDVYRTTKGNENRGIPCAFAFQSAGFDPTREEEYRRKRGELIRQKGRPAREVDQELAREFGYYEVPAFEVVDYHTQSVDVPGGLIDSAVEAQGRPAAGSDRVPPALTVRVACLAPSQYVGMARYDLYLRADEGAGAAPGAFAANFAKGALGLWLRVVLLTAVAVSLSTFFSGVISFLVALVLYNCGVFRGFITELATGTAPEGGPSQAFIKLVNRDPGVGFVDDSAFGKAAVYSDSAFRWVFRRFLDVIPDVSRMDLTSYVQEGFNIPFLQLLLAAGILVGYLLPWVVLAFYLMRWREIAGNQ
jgi:hypothetical protein